MSHKHKHTETTPASPAEAEPQAAPPTDLAQELDRAKVEAAENWDKFLRAAAELENYRKRVAREKEELARYTSERVVAALLPVVDNFERALVAAEQQPVDNTALLDGLKQIQTQFRRTLEEFGLKEVIAHEGHRFDPNLHEAVGHIESATHPEGRVIEQLQRGYKLADRLLRPARVVVSKGPPAPETPNLESEIPE
ncbi:MAG TPA: nucleotide exchange factor GrpE [Verrucomicrobiae bacterium]|nr:nucleotide exchange factor GrpE [Verrucomicrobiae bacterium]